MSYTQPMPMDSGSPQEASMVLDSDDVLEVFTILMWDTILMLVLVVVALPCPQHRHVVRQ
jgi:hypothetical protein